jgi:hypothetical protein
MDEIQHAHDILGAALEDDNRFKEMAPEVRAPMHAAYDTLCWVLEHNHNPAFGNNLAKLQACMEQHGVKLVKFQSHSE